MSEFIQVSCSSLKYVSFNIVAMVQWVSVPGGTFNMLSVFLRFVAKLYSVKDPKNYDMQSLDVSLLLVLLSNLLNPLL